MTTPATEGRHIHVITLKYKDAAHAQNCIAASAKKEG